MAKTKRQRQRKSGEHVRVDARTPPTPEQMQRGEFSSAGMAYRRTPVIDTMLERGDLTAEEHRRLWFYRDQASIAERSPVKSCLDQRVGGSSDIPIGATITSALLTTARIERDLGSLASITRAVAVDDKTLTDWCVERFGGRERYGPSGKLIAIVPINEKRHVQKARLELKYAAGMIVT